MGWEVKKEGGGDGECCCDKGMGKTYYTRLGAMMLAKVPLPTPGAPRKTKRDKGGGIAFTRRRGREGGEGGGWLAVKCQRGDVR
jgi:hypothetical protein